MKFPLAAYICSKGDAFMNQVYDVMLFDRKIGRAEVKREGLYYHFRCRCQLPRSDIYTIAVSCNEITRNLGVCVPMEECFGLDTKVPAKHIGEGCLLFRAVSKDDKAQTPFYLIKPDEPFGHLTELKNAVFCIENNQPGIRIRGIKG